MADFGDEIIIRDSSGKFKVLRGGQFYDWEAPKTQKKVAAPLKLVDIILQKSGLQIKENLKIRLAEIIDAYEKDIRDRFETKNTLTRKTEEGGMGFTSEQVDLLIRLLEAEREKGLKAEKVEKAVSKAAAPPSTLPTAPPVAAPPPPSAKAAAPPRAPAPKVLPSAMATAITPVPEFTGGEAEFVFSPADEAEILAHAQKLPTAMVGLKPIEVAKFISEITRKSGVVLDETNRKKLENILLTRLKDIRDGFETKETLVNAAAGIAMAPEQIEKILKVAKAKFQELDDKLRKEQLEKVQRAMEEEKSKAERARQEAEEKVKTKIDERWQGIAKRDAPKVDMPTELISPPITLRPKVSSLTPPAPPSVLKEAPPQAIIKPAVEKVVVIGKKIETKVVEKENGLKIGKTEKIQKEVAVGAGEAVKVLAGEMKEPPKPLEILRPSAPRVIRPIPRAEGKPRLDDIKYVPKLVGPVEELREMTLVDFRRLSGDPRAAASKIKEKLNLLEKESFAKRIAGIKAWQESEVSKIYLEISRESLSSGLPARQVISLRQSAGKPTLKEEEFEAILELNRILRY